MASPRGKQTRIDWWRLSQLFKSVAPDDGSQRARIQFMERNTVLPVKAVYFLVLILHLIPVKKDNISCYFRRTNVNLYWCPLL